MSFTIGCRPALGQFLSPDTMVPAAGNALDYHRYAYTRFNPVKYTDPTGHQATDCDEGIGCSFQNAEWEGLLSIIFSQSQRDDLRFLWRNSEEMARQFVVINSTPNRVVGVMMAGSENTTSVDFGVQASISGLAARGGVSIATDDDARIALLYSYGGGGTTPAISVGPGTTLTDAGDVAKLMGNSVQLGGNISEPVSMFAEAVLFRDNESEKVLRGISIGGRGHGPLPGSIHATVTNTGGFVIDPIGWASAFSQWLWLGE